MKFLIFIIFLLLINCSTPISGEKRVYICGDHPCINNKEVKDYFDNNISIEVYTISSSKKKDESFSLVDLNLLRDKLKTKNKITITEKKKKINEQIKQRQKVAKLKIEKFEKKKDVKNTSKIKDNALKKEINKKNNEPSNFTFVRICKNLEECDIDKISKIIMDIGKEKDFPKIN